jgi:hypothetical protein
MRKLFLAIELLFAAVSVRAVGIQRHSVAGTPETPLSRVQGKEQRDSDSADSQQPRFLRRAAATVAATSLRALR